MQSIGERLEEARKRKGISIREAAEATKIRGEYLHKYEGNQFDIDLPDIYVRGFLRTYANYLKLPADKIINDYKSLGIHEAKAGKGLNREVYGRLDLSVSTAKPEKEPTTSSSEAPPAETSEAKEVAARNPATFVPRPATPIRIDRNLLFKGSVLGGVGIILLILLVWLFSGRQAEKTARGDTPAESQTPVWYKPIGAEASFSLVADGGRVQVTATSSDGVVLFRGFIPNGESREIPRRGKPINIRTENPESLKMRFDGAPTPYPMPSDQKTGGLSHFAIVDAAR